MKTRHRAGNCYSRKEGQDAMNENAAKEYIAAQKGANKPISLLHIQELTGLNHAARVCSTSARLIYC